METDPGLVPLYRCHLPSLAPSLTSSKPPPSDLRLQPAIPCHPPCCPCSAPSRARGSPRRCLAPSKHFETGCPRWRAIRETHGCRDATSDGDTSPLPRRCPGFHVPLQHPISTSQDGHQHIRAKTTATPFPTEGSPLLFCFLEWLGFALMLPPLLLLLEETQAWVRPLNLPCMTMLQSSRPASAAA